MKPDQLEDYYNRYGGDVIKLLRSFGMTSDQAEDLASEVWLEVIKKISTLKDINKFWPWIWRICHNRFIDEGRKKKIRPWLNQEPGLDPVFNHIEQHYIAVIDCERILSACKPFERKALVFRYFQGLQCVEISTIMGVSRATTKVRHFRARKKLKKQFS